MQRVLPGMRFLEMKASDPIFHSFFEIETLDNFPQAYNAGRPVFRGIYQDNDPKKRLVMIVNYNTDISQFWEWSGRGLRSIDQTNEAYKLGVNYLMYGMTRIESARLFAITTIERNVWRDPRGRKTPGLNGPRYKTVSTRTLRVCVPMLAAGHYQVDYKQWLTKDRSEAASFELAMERLRKKDADAGIEHKPVTDEQKAAIAEARSFYGAKIAELEVMHQSKLMETFDPAIRDTLDEGYRRERDRLTSDRDNKIEKIRR